MRDPQTNSPRQPDASAGRGSDPQVHPSIALANYSFGGLRGRFKAGKYSVIRCVDPISSRFVEFRTHLEKDNWLLRRFSPSVRVVDLGRRYQVLCKGQVVTAKPHIYFETDLGVRCVDHVYSGSPRSDQQAQALELVASAHGLRFERRTAAVVRCNTVLLENLDLFRRILTAEMATTTPPTEPPFLPEPGTTREAFVRQLQRHLGSIVPLHHCDVVLIGLHMCGQVQLNIQEAPYGPGTRVLPH